LGIPFIVIRKAGKLPGAVNKIAYGLEYGTSEMDIAVESVSQGQRVVVFDDLMVRHHGPDTFSIHYVADLVLHQATGGTAAAACQLLENLHVSVVEVHCLIEMLELNGKAKLHEHIPFFSLLQL
jgi:adenine phosphoribosyltransferase